MNSLIKLSINRKVTVTMFTLAVLLFGFVSFSRLKLNLLPELSYPTLSIKTEYSGAAPQEIENLVTRPIEEVLGVVKNVQKISSISRASESLVTLEFAWGTDMDFATLDVRERMDALALPTEVKKPSILKFDPSLEPIIRYGLYFKPDSLDNSKAIDSDSKSYDSFDENLLKKLRRFADEEIKNELEIAGGVASVKVSGGLEEEILVSIDQAELARLNISIEDVSRILSSENVNLSGGILKEGSRQYLVRTLNEFKTIEDIGDLAIYTNMNGVVKFLRDIANISYNYKDRDAISRISGLEAVELSIYKEGDGNSVKISENIKRKVEKIRKILPDNYKFEVLYDQSIYITQSINEVIKAGVFGGILAIFLLFFFLKNFWITVITSLSIPVSVIATFNLMYGFDISLNIMSLGGITLGIGMLLDNSIVVLENISRHRDNGESVLIASQKGAGEVAMAVTASTLTSIAVFFPLIFVDGIAGQLFKDQALTVTFSLLASLIVAITLIPMLASIGGNGKKAKELDNNTEVDEENSISKLNPNDSDSLTSEDDKKKKNLFLRILIETGSVLLIIIKFIFTSIPYYIVRSIYIVLKYISKFFKIIVKPFIKLFDTIYDFLSAFYPGAIKFSLDNKILIISIAATLFLLSIKLATILGVELIPQLTQGEFKTEIIMPTGTPLSKTDAIIKEVIDRTGKLNSDKIERIFSVTGSSNKISSSADTGGPNRGDVNLVLKDGTNSKVEKEVMDNMRIFLQKIPGIEYKFSKPTMFTLKDPIEVEISGFNLEKLKLVNEELLAEMGKSDYFEDIKTTMESGYPEVIIKFDRDKATALGLEVNSIAQRIVNKLKGQIATKFSVIDRKIDVLVKAKQSDFNTLADLKKLIVNPKSNVPITLQSVADIKINITPSEIRHSDLMRVVVIQASLKKGDLGTAVNFLKEKIINKISKPDGIVVKITGQNKEMKNSFDSLKLALILAIFLVYLVMASQFESFIHPLVILFTIPLALVGAVFALFITGTSINVVVFIGAILLAGIVVNNAIVLIDLINQLRKDGMSKNDAIVQGGKLRLRSILMTTLTTTLGLLPLALGIGEGAELRAPMAITVIGGLLVSTMLTLIVIPVVYSVLDRKVL